MPQDDLDHIPSIVATRDNEHPVASRKGRSGAAKTTAGGSRKREQAPARSSGAGLLARLLITVSLVAGAVACAWAWQLQQQLQQSDEVLRDYAARIGDLEARLSDTDEGKNQNAELQAAKIRELDSEVRKLWDNVWKKADQRLDKLESASSSQGKKISAAEKTANATSAKVSSAEKDLAKLKSVAGDLERLMTSAKANQSEVERVADTLNRINLDVNKLNKRVQANEESAKSVDAFRRQIMASVTDLQAAVRTLQSTAP